MLADELPEWDAVLARCNESIEQFASVIGTDRSIQSAPAPESELPARSGILGRGRFPAVPGRAISSTSRVVDASLVPVGYALPVLSHESGSPRAKP